MQHLWLWQATLADSFLADLDDLDDNEEPTAGGEEGGEEEEAGDDVDDEMADVEALNYDDLNSVAKLQLSQKFQDIMKVRCCKEASLVSSHTSQARRHPSKTPW